MIEAFLSNTRFRYRALEESVIALIIRWRPVGAWIVLYCAERNSVGFRTRGQKGCRSDRHLFTMLVRLGRRIGGYTNPSTFPETGSARERHPVPGQRALAPPTASFKENTFRAESEIRCLLCFSATASDFLSFRLAPDQIVRFSNSIASQKHK